jgi:hypothetical protein
MSMLNNVVGYWAYIRGTYIWGAYIRGGGAYSRRFTVRILHATVLQ